MKFSESYVLYSLADLLWNTIKATSPFYKYGYKVYQPSTQPLQKAHARLNKSKTIFPDKTKHDLFR